MRSKRSTLKDLADNAVSLGRGVISLRAATYNIHGFVGTDGCRQPDRIRRVLEEIKADVVALQEVDCFETTVKMTSQWIGEIHSCPFKTIAGPTFLRSPEAPFGNALVTHLEVDDVRKVDISVPGKEPRGIIDVSLQKDGLPFRVLATHLGLKWAERKEQLQRLKEQIMAGPTDVPVILLGDLNEPFPYGRALRQLCCLMGPAPAVPSFPSPVSPIRSGSDTGSTPKRASMDRNTQKPLGKTGVRPFASESGHPSDRPLEPVYNGPMPRWMGSL